MRFTEQSDEDKASNLDPVVARNKDVVAIWVTHHCNGMELHQNAQSLTAIEIAAAADCRRKHRRIIDTHFVRSRCARLFTGPSR